ncbi:MAG: hypothetical protein O2960_16570 [Verrucomicrobia bacterium]|nr:hypothetical protein [Verrucomicrobiota bacterium]
MASEKWNETGRVWEEDHGLLDAGQVAKCTRADVAEPLRSPIPTRMISNGEYMPVPQTENQKRVEERIEELSGEASRKLGIDRRRFLRGSGGMAAALLAMNEVFGRFFNVSMAELFEPDAFAAAAPPKDLFVFDDQLHFVRGSRPSPAGLRAIAQGPSSAPTVKSNPFNPTGQLDELGQTWSVWNPALVGLPIDAAYAHITQFIKDVYLDSQVTIGLLSNVTASGVQIEGQRRAPKNAREAQLGEVLTAGQTAAARNFVNEISGSTRMLCHGLLYVGKGNLEWIQEQTEKHEPDSWKGYNISNAAKVDNDPNSLMKQWRHDDEDHEIPGGRSDRVRVRFRLVRLAAMADRSALALPDSRGASKEVGLPGTHRTSQTENPGFKLGKVVRNQSARHGFVQCGAGRLRIADEPRPEDPSGVRPAQSGQHVQDERNLRHTRNRTGP